MTTAFLFLPVLLIAGPLTISAQTTPHGMTDTLALVGSSAITTQDLIDRIELMPWPEKQGTSVSDSVKLRAVYSLIAERLLAREASMTGLGHDSAWILQRRQIERMLVRDALYRANVRARVTVNEKELLEAMRRSAIRVLVLPFASHSEGDARRIHDRLIRVPSPDSLLTTFPVGRIPDTLMIRYGKTDPQLEDTAAALSSRRRVSDVFRAGNSGWVILYLLAAESDPEVAGRSMPDRRSIAEERLRSRKEGVLGQRYAASVLKGQAAETHPEGFETLATVLLGFLREDSLAHWSRGHYRLTVNDLADIAIGLASTLDTELIAMEGGGMSFGDVLEAMKYQEPEFDTLHPRGFRVQLNQHLRSLVAADLLSRQGFHEGLDQTPEVRREITRWDDAWLARAMERSIARSVTVRLDDLVDALIRYEGSLDSAYEVNVREILSDSLVTSLRLLDTLARGGDFRTLATRASTRRAWAARGGESGFFAIASHPRLGFATLMTDSGTVGGPLRLPEGFSLFSPIGKRVRGGRPVPAPDSLQRTVSAYVRTDKIDRMIQSRIAGFADRERVLLNADHLKRIEIAPFNMVTRRYIGFGGIMMGAPPLPPNYEWVRQVKDPRALIP